jgi:signal transduction histidine kinase
MCTVSVTDTGRGIPPEAMPRMFEKFYRVPDSESTVVGTGLGLPIAKKMVETLGGEMGVQSTYGKGSTFYFSLPLASPLPAQ